MQEIWAAPELIDATKAGVVIWRIVINSDDYYEVSNFGGVRSWLVASRHGRRRRATPKWIAPTLNHNGGYPCVTIYCEGRPRRYVPVSHLMAEAFICPRPGVGRQWEAGHHDDDRLHNTLDNIRWVTQQANHLDRKRNGRISRRWPAKV